MVTVPSFDRVNWSSETERKPEIQSSTMTTYFEETRALAQAAKNMAINIALSEYCGIESAAYALAVIRPDGRVATFVSDEVKTDSKFLFTSAFHNEFLVATGRAPSHPMLKHESDGEASYTQNDLRSTRYLSQLGPYRKRTPPRSHNAYDDDSSTDSSGSRKRLRATATRSRERAIPTLPTRTISIGDDAARDDVYRQCLKDMQQNGCKVLGKAWVKLLEPKKQSTYPYTKGASKRPPWWPAMTGPNKIRHKEPDHLHKRERIILLMHILGLIINQDPTSVARQRGVDVAKLEEVTREAMATWFADREKPKNAEKRGYLTQLFRVLYKEERYRRGELDGSATVSVNDGAGTTDDDDDSDPCPHHHQAHPISPFLPTPSSSLLSPSHPITSTAATDMQDYYPPGLPLRSSYIPTTPDTTAADDYADAPYPIHHHSTLTHNQHPQQPPTYPTRAWPAQEINIYTGGSPWPTPPAATSVPMQHFPFGISTSSPPQQQGQGAVFLPPPMAQGYEDVNGARGSFDGGWEVI
ncbi:hypothetical protein VC83_07779 [Pseudogymnoascus destructans]|uniref:Subtelomeric hrmA-associated cluster protein AFUB-079030/YDR124W-like helical bundle domain-containing protein n=2 Tax=Pseudogymnoascus destructans TaxID=655981 RepID=L8FRK5_PSED2|nr:uncharacterized protein VC83_07779 [Pseudogymnoascus destructans]ELR02351.1 hypothetical protein GMDG_05415 [Pseudogymnoascus destructans 20631-21]OAF55693.1 hypothetical protein VC83_07779 [Pseudogymnoascus destructans]